MQDKIQEIMGLIDDWSEKDFIAAEARLDPWSEHDPATPMQMLEKLDKEANDARALIESKLRELVREPLSDEAILRTQEKYVGGASPQYPLDTSDWINFARAIEIAHNITSASN